MNVIRQCWNCKKSFWFAEYLNNPYGKYYCTQCKEQLEKVHSNQRLLVPTTLVKEDE